MKITNVFTFVKINLKKNISKCSTKFSVSTLLQFLTKTENMVTINTVHRYIVRGFKKNKRKIVVWEFFLIVVLSSMRSVSVFIEIVIYLYK